MHMVCALLFLLWVVANQFYHLLWRHNGCDSVSNHQTHDCFLNQLFRRRKKTSMLRVTGLCAGNSPVTGEFPAQMASNAENVAIWWRHHAISVRKQPWKHGETECTNNSHTTDITLKKTPKNNRRILWKILHRCHGNGSNTKWYLHVMAFPRETVIKPA